MATNLILEAVKTALKEGEATVKRLMKDRLRGWYLKPENAAFKPVFAEDRAFEIIGKVIALQRSF